MNRDRLELRRIKSHWVSVSHNEKLLSHEKHMLQIMKKAIRTKSKILEVGVGNGRFQRIIKSNISFDFQLFGIDIGNHIIKSPGVKVIADARHLPFKNNSFDIVYSLGVLEHFRNNKKAAKEQIYVLKHTGYLFCTVPRLSVITIYRIYAYFKKKLYRKGTFNQIKGKNLNKKKLKNLFEIDGFSIMKVYTDGDFQFKKYFPFNLFPKYWLNTFLILIGKKE